ncbi:MAG TPA: hypothetical protein EYH27_07125, partial [Anaerolineales bacterium]|nr:hypothetical protein [Anaerolineales bacterium]
MSNLSSKPHYYLIKMDLAGCAPVARRPVGHSGAAPLQAAKTPFGGSLPLQGQGVARRKPGFALRSPAL